MIYHVTNNFAKINETQGIIQNASQIYTIEISDQPVADSGFLLYPLNSISFRASPIYLRCIDSGGWAAIRVVSFLTDSADGSQSATDNVDNVINDMWNGDYTSDPQTDQTIDDMWNSPTSPDTGDGFSDYLDDLFKECFFYV